MDPKDFHNDEAKPEDAWASSLGRSTIERGILLLQNGSERAGSNSTPGEFKTKGTQGGEGNDLLGVGTI